MNKFSFPRRRPLPSRSPLSVGSAAARDQIQIAGSSTVLPYAKIVAEQFGETFTNFKTPVVESGGSGAGIKEFCKGVGEDTIDIANSSRPIKKDELEVLQRRRRHRHPGSQDRL